MSRIPKIALLVLLAGVALAPRGAFAFSQVPAIVDRSDSSNVADPDENFDQASNCFDGDKQSCGAMTAITGGNGWSLRNGTQTNTPPLLPRDAP